MVGLEPTTRSRSGAVDTLFSITDINGTHKIYFFMKRPSSLNPISSSHQRSSTSAAGWNVFGVGDWCFGVSWENRDFRWKSKNGFYATSLFKTLLDEKTKNNFNLSEAELTSSFWVKRSKASKILPRARIQKFQPSSKMTFKEFGEASFLSFLNFFFMIRFLGPSSIAVQCSLFVLQMDGYSAGLLALGLNAGVWNRDYCRCW